MFYLKLFGGASIEADGVALTGTVAQRRRLALLALLASAPPGGISRERLAAYLFPEADAARAHRALSDALHGVRKALGKDAITTAGDELRLDPGVVHADVGEFEGALAAGELAQAASLYRGPFLDGFFVSDAPEFERWVAAERDRLGRKYGDTLEALARQCETLGDTAGCVQWLRKLAAHDPFSSRAAAWLMLTLERAGDPGGALQVARTHRVLLREELGIEPPPEIEAIAARLTAGPSGTSRGAPREPQAIPEGGAREADPAPGAVVAAPERTVPRAAGQVSTTARIRAVPSRRRGLVVAAGLVAFVAVAPLAHWTFKGPADGDDRPPIRSLAVLPLENVSRDTAERYFAEGMTDALITELARYRQLRVISPDAVRQYAGGRKSAGEIARDLDVDAVVRGTVLRSGDRVRITAHLVRPTTGERLSAKSYEGALRDVLTLQREAARAIAGGVHIALAPNAGVGLPLAEPIDPRAFDYYARAKYYRRIVTEESIQRAIGILNTAVAISPEFARAHGELALAYVDLYVRFQSSNDELAAKAFSAIQTALSLDPGQEEAHVARGRLVWTPAYGFPHSRVIADFKRVLARNPSSDEAYSWLGTVLTHLGLMDEARKALDMALASNPLENRSRLMIGQLLMYELKPAEALAAFRQTPPGHNTPMRGPHLAWALLMLGRREEAAATLDEALRLAPDDRNGTISAMQAVLAADVGDRTRAEEKIRVAATKEQRSIHFHHTAYSIGSAYSLLDRPDSAVKWLRNAAHGGFPCYPLFARDPALSRLRGDRRFVALLAELEKQFARHRTSFTMTSTAPQTSSR